LAVPDAKPVVEVSKPVVNEQPISPEARMIEGLKQALADAQKKAKDVLLLITHVTWQFFNKLPDPFQIATGYEEKLKSKDQEIVAMKQQLESEVGLFFPFLIRELIDLHQATKSHHDIKELRFVLKESPISLEKLTYDVT